MTMSKLPGTSQRDVTWLCTARRAPTWVTPRGRPPYRPYLILVLEQETDKVRQTHIQDERPTPEAVLDVLAKAMRPSLPRMLLGAGGRYAPVRVFLDDADLAQAIAPRLAEQGIRCEYRPTLPLVEAAWRELAAHLSRREPIPGLLSVPGATVPLVGELFAAAADYYRQAPWRWLDNSWPLEVHYPPGGPARYAVVLGSGGEYFGLSCYDSPADLRLALTSPEPEKLAGQVSWFSLVLEEATGMAFDDLDAMEKYGWPVAGDRAYPLLIKVTPSGAFTVPNNVELLWLAAALRVLPDFITRHLRANRGRPRPAEATYPLPNIHGGQQIALRYPVPGFELTEYPSAEEEEPGSDLEAFIEQWHWDEPSHEFARQMGAFLFEFLDYLATTGLSTQTLRKHSGNCWLIGKFTCDYGIHDAFSPAIFLGGPSYLSEFEHKVSDSRSALASYQATWRKLERYVRSLGYGSAAGSTTQQRRKRR